MVYKGMDMCDYCFEPIGTDGICKNCGLNHLNYKIEAGLLVPGTILLGKYIIGRTLGRGGFGATYLAFSSDMEKVVAIKEYFPVGIAYREPGQTYVNAVSQDKKDVFDKGARRFYEESSTIAKFNSCENIVSVYEFFYANNTAYYAMEYLDGSSLKEYISQKGGRLSEDETVKIVKSVCNALISVHSTLTLHRDIAPDNIFVCRDGNIKLIDFGAAKQVVSNVQQSYSVVLKQGFAPYEQYSSNGKQGAWTDIYALGATMYYMLTGKVPPDAISARDDDLKFDSSLNVSTELINIIHRCMAFEVGSRYQSAIELLTALEHNVRTFTSTVQNTRTITNTTRLPEPTVAVPKPVAKADNVNKSPNKLVYILLFAVIALICTISILWAYQNHENGYSEKDNEIYDADVENIIYNNCFNTDFGIYIKNLTTGYEYGYNEGDAFPASAMSQIVVLSSLSEVIENNNINLNTENVYFEYMPNGKESPESKYEDGKYIKLKKCIEDVAVYGDNNKSNLLVDYIGNVNNESNGFDVIKRITRDNDYYITRISRKIFVNPMYIDNSELPNITTPKEIAMMFESLINTSEFGDSAYMKKIFNPVSDEGEPIGINKFVPQVYDVCGANGLNTQSTNNVAIIEFDDQQVLVAILSNTKDGSTDNEDSEDREIVIGNLVDHILKTQF